MCGVIRYFAWVFLVATCAWTQQASNDVPSQLEHIVPGSRVFIEKMNGFEDYLAAAIQAKQVPVVVVTDRNKADFVISGSASSSEMQHHTHATIKAINKNGIVVFAYAYDQNYPVHGQQSAAEACAKNLKKEISHR